jgi:hypothetical protein
MAIIIGLALPNCSDNSEHHHTHDRPNKSGTTAFDPGRNASTGRLSQRVNHPTVTSADAIVVPAIAQARRRVVSPGAPIFLPTISRAIVVIRSHS